MVFCCKIKIGKYTFDAFSEVEIRKTWKRFTDTATVKLPKALHYRDGDKILPVKRIGDFIKRGDKVEIQLGYNTQLFTEFVGYVAYSPKIDIPYEIVCEDEMWILKQKKVDVSIEDATVKQIVQAVAPEYQLDCIDEVYGDFSMKNTTPVLVFNELKKNAGIRTFFRYDKETGKIRLVCGKIYTDEQMPKKQPEYKFGYNIIKSSLRHISKEEAAVKIYASSVQADGTVIKVEAGQDGGDIVRLNNMYVLSKPELEQKVENYLANYDKAEGYSGEITTFGFPLVEHGQVVHIIDHIYEQRDSKHFVDEVEINVTPDGGYRKYIEVGQKYREDAELI